MCITADQEARFYDQEYAQHLGVPDEALLCNAQSLAADLVNPARPLYERRRLYSDTMRHLLEEPLEGKAVLDYGCGTGDWGVMMATLGASVTLLDLSRVGIEIGLRRARVNGVAERVTGVCRDASDLSCFPDGMFDLVFACAALHHTVKYAHALAELVRVIRPGGRLILTETYGNNPLLNGLRRWRWRLHHQPLEAGEEVILSDREIAALSQQFREVEVRPLNLLAMMKRLFRGRFTHAPIRGFLATLEAMDSALLRICPRLRRYCGEVVVVARK